MEPQVELEILRDVEQGLRRGIQDLADLVGVGDEPRFKWIRLEIVRMQDRIRQLEQALRNIREGRDNPDAIIRRALKEDD
jgi:hypothetical protein